MDLDTTTLKRVEIHGIPFLIRPGTADEKVLDEIAQRRMYQNKKIRPVAGDLWFDIGAHIGAFCIPAALAGCRIIAYEPDEANYRLLLRNIELNHVSHLVTAQRAAVVLDDHERAVLWQSQRSESTARASALAVGRRGWEPFTAPAVNIWMEAAQRQPRFIKMDAEGLEFAFLDQLPAQIKSLESVEGLTLEYHLSLNPEWADYGRRLRALGEHFEILAARDRLASEGLWRGWIDPIWKAYRPLARYVAAPAAGA